MLDVVGSATLGGSLEITELYTPGGADSWTILTAGGGITGSFDTITTGYQVALANGDTELVLSLSGALLPGDANGDGCVDDLDLTALAVNWQQGCGGGGGFADALAAANVPEPATLSLLTFASGAFLRRRRS